MQTDYTDDQTERARELERSSAGFQTQPLVMPAASTRAASTPVASRFLGTTLVLVGGIMLLVYLLSSLTGGTLLPSLPFPSRGNIQGGLVLLTIASCFLFFSFWQRLYPLLIPGCILAGLSVGVALASITSGVSVLWGLSLGFLSIFLLSRTLFGLNARAAAWPVIPAVVLFGVGTIVAIANLPALLMSLAALLPVGLILAGLVLGFARRP